MPAFGNAIASTALPQSPGISQKVPKNSAPYRFMVMLLASRPMGNIRDTERKYAHLPYTPCATTQGPVQLRFSLPR